MSYKTERARYEKTMTAIKELGLFEAAVEANEVSWAGDSGYAYLIGALFHAAASGAQASPKAAEEMLETLTYIKQGLDGLKQELTKKAA